MTNHAKKETKNNIKNLSSSKPDIASTKPHITKILEKVGMKNVEIPILFRNQNNQLTSIPAKCDLFVSLDDPHAKGIHMSRLFLTAQEHLTRNELTYENLTNLLLNIRESHNLLSYSAFIKVDFDLMIQRAALISNNLGWRFYPTSIKGNLRKNDIDFDITFRITYSSTCPCSAALSRQLIQEGFLEEFKNKNLIHEEVFNWLGKEESQIATPHGQRSYADITVRFKDYNNPICIINLINMVEATLSTPVQSAVKREDEQEFARLNGSNFMFSEDAARKIKSIFDIEEKIFDYKIEVRHLESLHPHDAVAITVKGVPGGYQA